MERKFSIGTRVNVTIGDVAQANWGNVIVAGYARNNVYALHLVDSDTIVHASEHQITETLTVPCPKSDGGYDCTPFCPSCEGNQEVEVTA